MKNRYRVKGNYTIIYLPKADGTEATTVIDTEDLLKVASFPGSWHLHKHDELDRWYVRGWTTGGQEPLLHRYIMEPEHGQNTSHVNGNGLDNRKKNLRNVPIGKTALNTSLVGRVSAFIDKVILNLLIQKL